MARSPTKPSQRIELNSFVQGLVTEASPLNYPANASLDEANFELNRDGSRDRRRGMDYEIPNNQRGLSLLNANFQTDYGLSTFLWNGVDGNAYKIYLVVQIRNTLYIYDSQKNSISSEGFRGQVTIAEFSAFQRYSFASVDGYLIVVSGADVVAVVSGNNTDTFTYETKRIRVRDVWGIEITGTAEDRYETDDNWRGGPNTPDTQIYNLQNQSWGIPRRRFTVGEFDPFGVYAVMMDPLTFFQFNTGSVFPSNSETVYAGLQFAAGSLRDVPSERMYLNLWDDVRGLGQKAAKGYFIIDLLRRGSSRVDEAAANRVRYPLIDRTLTATRADYTTGGPTVATGFSGRVFYSGFNGEVVDGDARSPSLTNFVVFSQLVKNVGDINKCYQEGDPTSRESSEVVDTDGGFIKIAGAEKIIGLRALGNSLIVFATNGIWEIQGGSDYGFSATNYKVTKLSSIGAFSSSSIVEEVGRLFFWGEDGIYTVGKDQFESMVVKSITQTTIQTLYDNIPSLSKTFATGVYDQFSKKIRWVYNLGTPFTSTSDNRELVLDIVLGAFYENRIGNPGNNIEIYGCFSTSPFTVGQELTNVIAGANNVIASTNNVVVGTVSRESRLQSVKYIVITQFGAPGLFLTFSTYNNTEFIDWEQFNGVGVDAKAYLLTGARTMGDSSIDKQTPYLFMHFRRTENGVDGNGDLVNPSGCLMRTQWDFANTAESMKFTPMVQVYRYNLSRLILTPDYDTGFEIITTKNKVRGRGKAFSMYLETEPKKDCRILGWNLSVNANSIA